MYDHRRYLAVGSTELGRQERKAMRLARFSISALVFAVALIAVDIVLAQNLFVHSRPAMVSVRFGLLMLNILAIAVYQLWARRGTRRPFLIGLVAAGTAIALLCQASCWSFAPDTMDEWQARWALPVAARIIKYLPRFSSVENGYRYFRILFYATTIPAIAIVVGLPQLIIAVVGGLISVGASLRWPK